MGFPRQGYWRGLPIPSPGDLPNSGIESGSPAYSTAKILYYTKGRPTGFDLRQQVASALKMTARGVAFGVIFCFLSRNRLFLSPLLSPRLSLCVFIHCAKKHKATLRRGCFVLFVYRIFLTSATIAYAYPVGFTYFLRFHYIRFFFLCQYPPEKSAQYTNSRPRKYAK